jgi:Tfp pilus assembly protein PilF
MSNITLQAAIKLYQQGQREKAKSVITNIVQIEPGNESAWLWLAACLDT